MIGHKKESNLVSNAAENNRNIETNSLKGKLVTRALKTSFFRLFSEKKRKKTYHKSFLSDNDFSFPRYQCHKYSNHLTEKEKEKKRRDRGGGG